MEEIERKHRDERLDGSVFSATLEPCTPGARKHPKLSCAERILWNWDCLGRLGQGQPRHIRLYGNKHDDNSDTLSRLLSRLSA